MEINNTKSTFTRKGILISFVIFLCAFTSHDPQVGDIIDTFNGVPVYYNGRNFTSVYGRNKTSDGYNLGLKYQCVEFVKRYYYDVFDHKMPSSFGHAKDFFDHSLQDIDFNKKRGMVQYRNTRESRPAVHDILVYGPSDDNQYGHVAIISNVTENQIEIIQQNMGKMSRQKLSLVSFQNYWTVADYNISGWLRLPSKSN